MINTSNEVKSPLLWEFWIYNFSLSSLEKVLGWKHCKYKEWLSFFLGSWGMNRSAEQTNRPRTASRFTRFVCPALRFIPHEPRKKDTHSLSIKMSIVTSAVPKIYFSIAVTFETKFEFLILSFLFYKCVKKKIVRVFCTVRSVLQFKKQYWIHHIFYDKKLQEYLYMENTYWCGYCIQFTILTGRYIPGIKVNCSQCVICQLSILGLNRICRVIFLFVDVSLYESGFVS